MQSQKTEQTKKGTYHRQHEAALPNVLQASNPETTLNSNRIRDRNGEKRENISDVKIMCAVACDVGEGGENVGGHLVGKKWMRMGAQKDMKRPSVRGSKEKRMGGGLFSRK